MKTSRRDLLQSAAGVALGASAAGAAPATGGLPTVRFGRHDITRLLCGANPFYGYSHSTRLLDAHMREWMTQDRVVETLRNCEANGINTWQLHYSEQTMADLKRYRSGGGKMNIFFLSMRPLHQDPKKIAEVAAMKPVGIAHHGNMADDMFREGRMAEVHEFLKRIRDTGSMVGLSCHNPRVVEYAEEKGWDVDYYMTCFYRISRTREEARQELGGEAPLGEVFLEKDPVRMTAVVRQTSKPCLGFKILGAGRNAGKPENVAQAFDFALANIKPTDAVIVGMYPRYRDQVRENVEHLRRAHGKLT